MYINAIGHYLPSEIIPNEYFQEMNGLTDEWITKRTGISTRVRCNEDENGNTMAVESVKSMKENYNCDLTDVDLIVGATYTPYDTIMTLAHAVQREFKIDGAVAVSITSACSSFLNALEIVEGYFASGKSKKAIVIVSEHNSAYSNDVCSKSGHLWGDGAAAILISTEKETEDSPEVIDIYTEGLGHLGQSDEAVYLRPNHGKLEMPIGRDVFIHACNYMAKALELITKRNDRTVEDLDYIIPHQANIRIMKNVANGLKIPTEKIIVNVDTLGNTGSASTLIGLSERIASIPKGSQVAFTVFGGGYSTGAMLLKV